MPEVGQIVGRYEIVGRIGRGGMGVVHLARQLELDRLVALKELALGSDDPSATERFLREARVAGSLSHPNIVTVHDYFHDGGTAYISMEYLQRGSLRPYVGRLTLAQIAGVLEGLLAGLSAAESAGVVHRDLKLENLLVTAQGSVKIADFGISKAVNQATGLSLTATGMALGSPAYMAPEQAMATNAQEAWAGFEATVVDVLGHGWRREARIVAEGEAAAGVGSLTPAEFRGDEPTFVTVAGPPPPAPAAPPPPSAPTPAPPPPPPPAAPRPPPPLAATATMPPPLAPGPPSFEFPAPESRDRRGAMLVAGVVLALAAIATVVAAALYLGGDDGPEQVAGGTTIVTTVVEGGTTETVTTTTEAGTTPATTSPSDAEGQQLRAFVGTLDSLLAQSSSDRSRAVELVGIVSSSCSPETAERGALDMERVAGSRQRTLDALNAVAAPTAEAVAAVDRLRDALEHSIDANERYVQWMEELASSACTATPAAQSSFGLADAASARATAAKKRFVAAFNPLAARFGRPTWTHDRI